MAQLNKFVSQGELNELEEQGLIKAVENIYELAWKTLQDLLRDIGYPDVAGPKRVINQAFQDGYIDGYAWVQMSKSRNLTSHTFHEETAHEIAQVVRREYADLLNGLSTRLESEKQSGQFDLYKPE